MIYERKRNKLDLPDLRPWDTEAEPAGLAPLRPFATGKELLEKLSVALKHLDPSLPIAYVQWIQ